MKDAEMPLKATTDTVKGTGNGQGQPELFALQPCCCWLLTEQASLQYQSL